MPFPIFAIGPSVAVAGRLRDWQQSRRKVRLTVHRANAVAGFNSAGQPIPGPERTDYKSSNQFCKAEQSFWGDQFGQRYRNFGQCVSGSR